MKVQGLFWCGSGFLAGLLCSHFFFVTPVTEYTVNSSTNSPVAVRAEAVRSGQEPREVLPINDLQNPLSDTVYKPNSHIEVTDVTTYSREDTELSFDDLVSENQQLHMELERLKTQLAVTQEMPNMAATITSSLASEVRDPQFADEMELQVKDFVYQFGFDQDVELSLINCKSTVCEISFSPKDNATFDERTWRKVSDKLFETPWWKTFKASTSTSGNNQMTILATTHWPSEPKRVAQ